MSQIAGNPNDVRFNPRTWLGYRVDSGQWSFPAPPRLSRPSLNRSGVLRSGY
jgi:hypothetical protein